LENKNPSIISSDLVNVAIDKTYDEGIYEIYQKIVDNFLKLKKYEERKYFFYMMFYALYKLSFFF
jgi:hypothetical protein